MRPLQSDQILILLQAIAIAWPVSVLALSAHTPQPTPPIDDDDDDDDEQRPGGGSGGGNIDPDHDDSGPDEDDEEDDDDEGDTLWTRVKARLPGSRP